MKKIIALVLALCMSLGMIVSVSAANPFVQRLNLVRLIRAMFSSDDVYEIGEVKNGVLTVYVAVNGKKDADGTKKNPTTLESARDAIREIDKTNLRGVDVVLTAGEYVLTETFSLTAEDSGTKDCPIRYIGEDGTKIIGGQAIKASDFTPATGSAVQYIPEEVRAAVVQLDLKKYGYTPEDVAKTLNTDAYTKKAIRLFSNGEMQTIARYPNIGEEITIIDGDMLDKDGNVTDNDGNQRPNDPDLAVTYVIYMDKEHIDRALTWHAPGKVFLNGYVDLLWRVDHTYILEIAAEDNMIEFNYPGTSAPAPGRTFYLYNIPEELDTPGEYYIDNDAILYYYPTEDFDSATLSVPVVDKIINIKSDYTTLENLTFETSGEDGIVIDADNVTVYSCTIRGIINNGIVSNGYNNVISTCHIHNIGAKGADIDGGDEATLTHGNNLFTNNYVHDFGILARGYNGALSLGGCGNTASHNEMFGSEHMAIHWSGTRNVIEYNYIHDVCLRADDMGAIYGGGIGMIDCTVRYNYIQNVGIPLDDPLGEIEGYNYCGAHAVYWDMYNGHNNTYGNIIENVRGCGIAMGNGKNCYVANNLFISCHHAVRMIAGVYNEAYFVEGGERMTHSYDSYVYNDIWVEAYPLLSTLIMDMKATTADDPLSWASPTGIVIKDNFFYGDRANTDSKKAVKDFELESHVINLNPDTIEYMDQSTGTLIVFNSKRNGMPDIKEALETAYATTGITYEQFLEMGTDWTPAE